MRNLSHLKRVPWIVALVALGALPSAAQQADDLQGQLQQLKQQYDTTTRDLEQRIAALEQQIEKQKETSEKTNGTVSTLELVAEQAAQKAVHGYFRSGYGLNSVGGQQVAFEAPGADANTAWEMKRKPMRN
jgi:hypothetical protein